MAVAISTLLVVILAAFCSAKTDKDVKNPEIDVLESPAFPDRICHEDEVCYLGYVFVDPIYNTASLRVRPTWYVKKTFLCANLLFSTFSQFFRYFSGSKINYCRCRCSDEKLCAFKNRTPTGIFKYYCQTKSA